MECIEELAANATARWIVFDKQDLGLAHPSRIDLSTLLPGFLKLGIARICTLGWHAVRNVVDVFAVHGIDSICLSHGIYEIVDIAEPHGIGGATGRWWPSTGRPDTANEVRRRRRQSSIHPHRDLVHVFQIPRIQHDVGIGFAQQLSSVLQWRGRNVVFGGLVLSIDISVLRLVAICILREGISNPAVSAALCIDIVQEGHDILHHMLVIDDRFLQSDDLLQQHRMVNTEFVVAILKRVQLRLCCDQLVAHHIHLLRRNYHFLVGLIRLAWCRRFPPNVVQCILVVHLEVRVLKLPCLEAVSFGRLVRAPALVEGAPQCATYARSIRRLPVLFIVVSHFVKVILVQLAHETREIAVLEVLGQYVLCEFFVLAFLSAAYTRTNAGGTTYFQHHKTVAVVSPSYNVLVGWVFEHPVSRISNCVSAVVSLCISTYLYSLRTCSSPLALSKKGANSGFWAGRTKSLLLEPCDWLSMIAKGCARHFAASAIAETQLLSPVPSSGRLQRRWGRTMASRNRCDGPGGGCGGLVCDSSAALW